MCGLGCRGGWPGWGVTSSTLKKSVLKDRWSLLGGGASSSTIVALFRVLVLTKKCIICDERKKDARNGFNGSLQSLAPQIRNLLEKGFKKRKPENLHTAV